MSVTAAKVAATTITGSQALAVVLSSGVVVTALIAAGSLTLPGRNPSTEPVDNVIHDINSGSLPGDDEDTSQESPQSEEPPISGQTEGIPDTQTDPYTPPASAGAPPPAEWSGYYGDGILKCTKEVLHYPRGTQLSLELLYQDAGVTGLPLEEIEVLYLEDVDVESPREYAVLLLQAGTTVVDGNAKVLVIVIE